MSWEPFCAIPKSTITIGPGYLEWYQTRPSRLRGWNDYLEPERIYPLYMETAGRFSSDYLGIEEVYAPLRNPNRTGPKDVWIDRWRVRWFFNVRTQAAVPGASLNQISSPVRAPRPATTAELTQIVAWIRAQCAATPVVAAGRLSDDVAPGAAPQPEEEWWKSPWVIGGGVLAAWFLFFRR